MSKISDKFNRLGAGLKFGIVFSIWFILGLMAIPVVLHSDHRIFPDCPEWKFIVFAVLVCAAYAVFLAGTGVIYDKYFTRRK